MKVLHIISSSGMYGAEAVILNLARTLAERGGHICALGVFENASNPNRQLYDAAVREGIESHLVPCSGQFDRSTIQAIRALATEAGADVIHAHGYKADIYCLLALRHHAVALVSTCHTWYDTDFMVTMYGKLDRLVLRNFHQVVAVSQQVRQRLLAARVEPARIHIVRNGIDLRPFAAARPSLRDGLDEETPVVGLIGRLAWEKGVDVFAAAAAQVLSEFGHARFVIVGEGPDREKLEDVVRDLKLDERFEIAGRRDDMPSVYASLDIMVSASRQEGLPMAILEGMASGLPLVATAAGEVPTIVEDGRTGILVPPENPALLAGAILTLLRDPAKRAAMGVAGRQRVREEFSADRMAANYLQVYEHAIAATGVSISGKKTI